MNSVGILEIIAVYASAIIILLLLIATVIFRIIGENARKRRERAVAPVKPEVTRKPSPIRDTSGVPGRLLPSSDLEEEGGKQNIVIGRIEQLSTLKRGIMWAEILGRPGGRRRRNT